MDITMPDGSIGFVEEDDCAGYTVQTRGDMLEHVQLIRRNGNLMETKLLKVEKKKGLI